MTILLPGAFLVIALLNIGYLRTMFEDFFLHAHTDWIRAGIYLGTAYVAGHVVYFFSSFIDTIVYENVQKVFWKDRRLLNYILKRKAEITGINDGRIINTFKWSCAWLLKNNPEMYAQVERYVAESKFFRSLIVVFTFSFFIFLTQAKRPVIIFFIFALLIIFSFIRYITQRRKSIETAYHYIIVLSEKPFPPETKLGKESVYERSRIKAALINLNSFFKKTAQVISLIFLLKRKTLGEIADETYKSREIRWFLQEENQLDHILQWLKGHNEGPGENDITEERTDKYLMLPGDETMSIKQRNGKIEIKQRTEILKEVYQLNGNKTGQLEEWVKYVFTSVKDANSFVKKIFDRKEEEIIWQDVKKKRLSVKITEKKYGRWQFHNPAVKSEQGCQIEYTTITIAGKSYYTFAMEWFGENPPVLDKTLLHEILGEIKLELKDSTAYPGFLNRHSKPAL